ncbi:hypothetical protein BGZ49_001840 [Haplosporangium sp. Z 27]|nr:hypothetical protein BGZ49_001840 [Haplosporangium sp. Z 27]
MFKKRAPAKKKVDEEEAITVSVPQDFDSSTSEPNAGTSTSSSSAQRGDSEDSVRNGIENRNVQPHQPWKPWDPPKRTMNGRRTSQNSKIGTLAPTLPSSTSTTTTTVTSTTTDKKSPNGMLSMFSSNPSTPQQPQPKEAQLWNAESALVSPISPATPRYIPAIAGNAANSRTHGSNSSGRLTSGWTVGAANASRRSNEGNIGLRSFGQVSDISSSPGSGTGSRNRSPSISSTTTSIATSPTMSSPPNHYKSGSQSKAAGSLRPPNQHFQSGSSNLSSIPTMSNGSLKNRPVDGSQRKSSNYFENAPDSNYGHRDEDLQDFKKDRSHSHGHGRYPAFFRDPKRVLRARLFCLRQNRRLHPGVRLVVIVLLVGSVLYTTFHLVFRESNSKDTIRKSFDYTEQQLRFRSIIGGAPRNKVLSSFDVEAQRYSVHQWALETHDVNNSKAIVRVSEDYMLSKAFNGAMQPTRVIPFYFKASFADENDDDDLHEDDDDGLQGSNKSGSNNNISSTLLDPSMVTITTLITPDRYGVFLKLVKQYRGPISVATHIRKGPDQDKMFHELNEFFSEHAILRKYVDLHVIVDGVDFQLNMWRNVARMFARTDYFMMLDVDFHIPSTLKNHLHHDPRIRELLSAGAALVVPAFEYSLEHDPKDSKYFPETKAELIPLLEKKHIRVFHDSFPPGHAATDTPRWIKMSKRSESEKVVPPKGRAGFEEDYVDSQLMDGIDAEEVVEGVGEITEEEREEYLENEIDGERPYKVTAFEPKYEPYIVLKREGTPWCDERFVGYGANKAACLFEIYISGIDFWVMPHDFLIHQYHDYPTTNRKNGRILNKQLFLQFQQERCYATLGRMIITGEWYTSKADNLRHQCGSFENFLKSADDQAQEFEDRYPNSLLEDPVFVADVDSARKKSQTGDGTKDRKGGDRYEGGDGKEALGDQIVDDDEHQDPFMSRPKGKVWGGVQPRKYYVPPPPQEGLDIPVNGIDINDAIAGELGPDTTRNSEEANEIHGNDLTGEKLEQFRQGIILTDQFDVQKQDDNQIVGDEGTSEEQAKDEGEAPTLIDQEYSNDKYEDEDSDDKVENDGALDSSYDQDPPQDNKQDQELRFFENEAEKLEEKYRLLGVYAS